MTPDDPMTPDDQAKPKLTLSSETAPVSVPTFACIVYVAPEVGGGVRARVGNLDGIEENAASEREALAKIAAAFKAEVKRMMAEDLPIPWIDPPSAPQPGEQKRFIPVHL